MKLKAKILDKRAMLPNYAKRGDAGLDLYVLEDTFIAAKTTAAVKTGLAFEIEEGYEMQIRPRSGISLNGCPVLIANNVEITLNPRVILGTVESGYRGEIAIITENPYCMEITIPKGTKLAQGVINKIERAEIEIVNELGNSERGGNGFGSTGIK